MDCVKPINLLIIGSFFLTLGIIITCYLWFYDNKWIEIVNAILLSYVAGLIIYVITSYIPSIQKQKRTIDFLCFWIDAIIWQKDNFIAWKFAEMYLGEDGSSDSELFREMHIYPTKQDCLDIFEIIFRESNRQRLDDGFDSHYRSGGQDTKRYIEKLLLVEENFPELDVILFRLMTCDYVHKSDMGQPMSNGTFKAVKELLLNMYIDDFHEFCCIVKELEDFKTQISSSE